MISQHTCYIASDIRALPVPEDFNPYRMQPLILRRNIERKRNTWSIHEHAFASQIRSIHCVVVLCRRG